MTTTIKNTNIEELLEVARGNFRALERMTEEFRRRPRKVAASRNRRGAMTIQQAVAVAMEIIQENRENGELEGTLNRHRVAALKVLVRVAQGAAADAGTTVRK